MPTSQPRTLTPIHTIIQAINPETVIDLGVGHGKTGVLVREYLDIMRLRYKRTDWKTKIYGLEIYSEYQNQLWDYAYNKVFIGDALKTMPNLPSAQLILALDIWEHFTHDYAMDLLETCLNHGTFLLICTPKKPLSQGTVLGNKHEMHISKWSPHNFKHIKYRFTTSTSDDWIILLSKKEKIPPQVITLFNPIWNLKRALINFLDKWKDKLQKGS